MDNKYNNIMSNFNLFIFLNNLIKNKNLYFFYLKFFF